MLFFALAVVVMNTAFAQFSQAPLPYDYKALEPSIDARTMEIHYSKHHAGYVSNLNKAIQEEGISQTLSIEDVLANVDRKSVV